MASAVDSPQCGNRNIHPVPELPIFSQRSPAVVRTLDRIRFELAEKYSRESDFSLDEFIWFAREYPRCYRHHLDCAEFRLRTIHSLISEIHAELASTVAGNTNAAGCSLHDQRVNRVYWDFESYLSEINNSLDLLARVAGLIYRKQTPPNFNRFCKFQEESGMREIMLRAQSSWVTKLKSYRDCFTHFTPVDTMLSVGLQQYRDGFHIRAKLPTNPDVREILGFRYSRRIELLRYATSTWRHMVALDRSVAREISIAFRQGRYPMRTTGLFFVR